MVVWVPFCLWACYNVHVTENREIRGSFGMELEQAIQQASNNDPLAFEELYKQYYSLVYRSIRSLVSDEDEVMGSSTGYIFESLPKDRTVQGR